MQESVWMSYWQLQPVIAFQQGKRKLKKKSGYFPQYPSYSKFHSGAQKEAEKEGLNSSYFYDTQKEIIFN